MCFLLEKEEMVEFSKYLISWKILLEVMKGTVVLSAVDAIMYDVLSGEKEHVPCGESVGTTECIKL